MRKLLTILTAVLLLSGCSNNPNPNATPTPESKKTFTVGMECNYAPFNWTQIKDSDTAVAISSVDYCDGYDVVIAQRLADEMGMDLVIKKIAWEGLEPAVNSGEIDAIIAGMTETPERAENVDFTSPYYESDMVMIVRADDPLVNATSIQDFSGSRVLGQLNTTYDDIIDQINDVNHATPLANYPLMVLALQNKDVDALTAELPVARGVVEANPDLAIVMFAEGNGFDVDTSVSIGIKKGNTALFEAIQTALDSITQDERNQMMLDATNRQPASE